MCFFVYVLEFSYAGVNTEILKNTRGCYLISINNNLLQVLETKNMIDEERIEISENQLKEAKQMVEESDIKYDEVSM